MKKVFLYGVTTIALLGVLTSCGKPDLGRKVNKEEFVRCLNTTADATTVEDETPTGIKMNLNLSVGAKVQAPGTTSGMNVKLKLNVESNDSKLHAGITATIKEDMHANGMSQSATMTLVSNLWVGYSDNVLKAWSELATKNSVDPTQNLNYKFVGTATTGDVKAEEVQNFLKETYQSYSDEIPDNMLANLDDFLLNVEQSDPNFNLYVKGEGEGAKYSLTCNVEQEDFKGSALMSVQFVKAKLASFDFQFNANPVIKGLGQSININLGSAISAYTNQVALPTSDSDFMEKSFDEVINGAYVE